MTGFEPQTSGIGSDLSTNWVTTTAQPCLAMFVHDKINVICLTGIVNQNDLVKQLRRWPVDDTVEGPLEGLPMLVVERNDDADPGQVRPVLLTLAP